MAVGRIIGMRARRGFRIEAQGRVVELLVPDLAGVETHHRQLADAAEELTPTLLALAILRSVGERLEHRDLLLRRQVEEVASERALAPRLEPGQTVAHGLLLFLVMRNHEVYELRSAGLARAGRLIAGNAQVRQPLDDLVLRALEELRRVSRRPHWRRFGGRMRSRTGPPCEARKVGCDRSDSHDAQNFSALNVLCGHCRRSFIFIYCLYLMGR